MPPGQLPTSFAPPPFLPQLPGIFGNQGPGRPLLLSALQAPCAKRQPVQSPEGGRGQRRGKGCPLLCGLLEWPPAAPKPWVLPEVQLTLLPIQGCPSLSAETVPSLSPDISPTGGLIQTPLPCLLEVILSCCVPCMERAPCVIAVCLFEGSASPWKAEAHLLLCWDSAWCPEPTEAPKTPAGCPNKRTSFAVLRMATPGSWECV